MKKRIISFIAAFIVICMLLPCAGCFGMFGDGSDNSYNYNEESYTEDTDYSSPDLYDFYVDTDRVAVSTNTNVCAYIYAPEAQGAVELWNDVSYITDMYDDGIGADEAAGDGIYSACITVTANEYDAGNSIYLHVASGSSVSGEHVIDIFALPTEEQLNEVSSIIYDLDSIAYNNIGDTGSQLYSAESYIDELYNSGAVLEYIPSETGIDFVHSSGILCNFTPYEENTLVVGDGSDVSVITYDPFCDAPEFLKDNSAFSDGYRTIYANEQTYVTASHLASSFPNYSYPNYFDLDNSEVTLDNISNMRNNQIIIWNGHGGYSEYEGPFLVTGEIYNKNRIKTDSEYCNKFLNGELIASGGRVAVTGKYILNNLGSLSGSIVYLNACCSAKNAALANAFIKKGAMSVLGYSDNVYIPYAEAMQYTILTNMTYINESTGDYNTMQDAIDYAIYNYGENDTVVYPDRANNRTAYLVTYGLDPANVRLASVNGGYAQPEVTPEPQLPLGDSNTDAHNAYKSLLTNYAWIPYCPSDLSEIPPSEYDAYGLGSYYILDIDNNGIDEIVIKAGQSIADMSMTVFTYSNGNVIFSGNLFTGDAWVSDLNGYTGAVITEHHGGSGIDTYIDMTNNEIYVTDSFEYNYEAPDYVDDKANIAYPVNVYNVHDLSGL